MSTSPSVSVVVGSGAGGDFLIRCLDSLEGQVVENGAELIVVDRCGPDRVAEISSRYPHAKVVPYPGPDRPSVPQMRAHGVDLSSGPIVAIS